MSKHTPGPWSVWEEETRQGDFKIRAIGAVIGAVWKQSNGISDANARLVAAAPDLLAAAKEAQCTCTLRQRDSGHMVGCWMPALTEAIAKAEST